MSASSNVESLLAAIKAVNKSEVSELERQALLTGAAELQIKMEKPWDTIHRLAFVTPALVTSIKTLLELNLFAKWVSVGGGPKTVAELAALVGCEETLIVRLIRVVASAGLANVSAPHTYEMNEFSQALARTPQKAAFEFMWNFLYPSYFALPRFLEANEYRNPHLGPNNAAFQRGLSTSQSLFEHLKERPKDEEDFANCMIGYAGAMAPWVEIFPTEQLLDGAGPDDVVVVDVGGGVGHDLMHFQKKHKLNAERVILQDQEAVLANAVSKDDFTAQAHNFFEAQPVQGARAYYLHSVLHDWPDEQSAEILIHLRASMSPHSRVLLHEMVLVSKENPSLAAQSDVLMMAAFNGLERTEEMWKQLATTAGLRIAKVYTSKASPYRIIEMKLL